VTGSAGKLLLPAGSHPRLVRLARLFLHHLSHAHGMGSTWDPALVQKGGGHQQRGRANNNMPPGEKKDSSTLRPQHQPGARPRWGRTERLCRGPPPAFQHGRGLHQRHCRAASQVPEGLTAQHYAANNYEKVRKLWKAPTWMSAACGSILPAFQAAVMQAIAAQSCRPTTKSTHPLQRQSLVLQDVCRRLGFDGFVTSDCDDIPTRSENH